MKKPGMSMRHWEYKNELLSKNGGTEMSMQEKFYEFRKKCKNGVLINNQCIMNITELKERIDNIVEELIELSNDKWVILLDNSVKEESRIIYVKKL